MKTKLIFIIICLIFIISCEKPEEDVRHVKKAIEDFSDAKKALENRIYFDHHVTIYCGAEYNKKKEINLPQGFYTTSSDGRSYRMEWEHAVPVENFGQAFREWREGDPRCVHKNNKPYKGRKCAQKVNADFRRMECDLYNLFPAIGAVNAVRANHQYAMLPDDAPTFGSCPSKYEGNRFEPRDEAKGQLARTALYMADRYKEYNLSRQQRQLFEAWDRQFPVDSWECTRARRIEKIQGNENRFVKNECRQKGLW